MKNLFAVVLTLLSTTTFAANVFCSGKSAGIVMRENLVSSLLDVPVPVFEMNSSAVYLTLKNDGTHILEMFMPSQEQRVYSVGVLTSSRHQLGLAVWTRDELLEINCRLAK